MRRPFSSRCAAPRRRRLVGHRSIRTVALLVAPVVLTLAAIPAWSITQGDQPDCADDETAAPLDEYGFPLDPGLLVPCDELVGDAPEPAPVQSTPAVIDPDPSAGSDLDPEALGEAYAAWRSSTGAALVDQYFQRILLLSRTCDSAWFDEPYDGGLRVADGTPWRSAVHTAMASVPDPESRALLYRAQDAFWRAGRDCDRVIEDWLTETEAGLDDLEAAVERLDALR